MPDSLPLDNRDGEKILVRRLVIASCGVLLLSLLLALRMLYLQVWQHDQFRARSDNNRVQMLPLPPPRGLVFDRNSLVLAESRPVFTLDLVPERVPNLDQQIKELGTLVTLDTAHVDRFHDQLSRSRRPLEPVTLKYDLSDREAARLAVNRHRLPGMEINFEAVRDYPHGPLVAHAVGSVRRISVEDRKRLDMREYRATHFVGKIGVEGYYESLLHGQVGSRRVETDARGQVRQVLEVFPPVAGQNLTLHLDLNLQIAAAGALGGRRGAVVAIQPSTGGILAMVSSPAYDPNDFVAGMDQRSYQQLAKSRDTPLLNRATQGVYAPGSLVKPILGLAAISHGVVGWDDEIADRGEFRIPGQRRVYRDWNWTPQNPGGQGIVNLNRAIYRSSNIYFYQMGTRLSVEQISGFLRQFGFGALPEADFPDISPGLVPDPVWKRGAKGLPWYPGDNVNMSIGQGNLLVTPLQVAVAAATLANRGRRVRPRMLLASDGVTPGVEAMPPLPAVQGPSAPDWQKMAEAMADVVHRGDFGYLQNGTAWFYIGRDLSYRMAGKSGTAQVVAIQDGQTYDEDELDDYSRKHAWFMAYAPVDKPRIAVAVLVENGGGGSSVAAPVARAVLDAYLLPDLRPDQARPIAPRQDPQPEPERSTAGAELAGPAEAEPREPMAG